MKNYISNQSGRSMIEMLGVLAIVGVLSVAGIAGYSKAMAKYKVNKAVDQISTIVANTRTVFSSQGNYKGLGNNTTAFNLGIFPEEMVKDCTEKSCDPKHAFGKSLTLMAYASADSQYEGYSYYYFHLFLYEISKDACTALVTTDWGPASGFAGFYKNKLITAAEMQQSAATNAATLCECSNNQNNCYLEFVFK